MPSFFVHAHDFFVNTLVMMPKFSEILLGIKALKEWSASSVSFPAMVSMIFFLQRLLWVPAWALMPALLCPPSFPLH
jgi:hypothetical protein